jgi:RNA-directed DNA polymerase
MAGASTPGGMSPKLLEVMERAKRDPDGQFYSLAHLIDEGCLERAYRRLRKDAAVGVDGVTVEGYGQHLELNLRVLHERMKSGQYRHQPIRRMHIPKGNGKTRPIGVSTVEDKVVQGALCEVLGAVYEPIFKECSYGFRPGRSAHDAIRALNRAFYKGEVSWILEADIKSYFDSINRKMLMEMLQKRVADGSIHRLVGKCLHVRVLDGEEYSNPEEGTTQGSVISPLLGNIYLHNVLDVWFEHEVRRGLRGKAILVRYADDVVMGFQRLDDAQQVMAALKQRMEQFGLTLHPEKTRLVAFHRPSTDQRDGKGPGTFDVLGFTWYWRRTRRGYWVPTCKTRRAKLKEAIQTLYAWCRSNRHLSIEEQHAALRRRIQGHFNYFGVNGNVPSLLTLWHFVRKAWHKWLNRRSQRASLTWARFEQLLADFPLPCPKVLVHIWAT